MRVIGGEFRSRRLKSVPGDVTRPTPDRLRETLFDVLQARIRGAVFLDAYAGTGAVGIEAVSRGAARAIFLEKDRTAADTIRENIALLQLESRAAVVKGAVLRTLAQSAATIVFLDPPYDLEREYAAVLELLSQAPPELVVVQHSVRLTLAETYGKLHRTRLLRQGDNALSFYSVRGDTVQASPDEFEQLKQRMRATWMAGDFGQIASYSVPAAEAFVARLGIQPGMQVLDVACGTGNLAIPAARAGAQVTGVDIAPNLLEQARARAAAESLTIAFEEGDVEKLSYSDGQFDVVLSMFGAMFAPRPERAAEEMLRVLRPGGLLAMANWTPDGFVGKMFMLGARFAPPPPGLAPASLWGSDPVVRARLADGTSEILTESVMVPFEYDFSPAEVVQFFRRYFGPTQMSFARLDEPAQAAYATALEKFWAEHNEAKDGRTAVQAEYLAVLATRA